MNEQLKETLMAGLEAGYIFLLSQTPEFRMGCQPELVKLHAALWELRQDESGEETQNFYEGKALSLRLLGDKDKTITGEALAAAGFVPASDKSWTKPL